MRKHIRLKTRLHFGLNSWDCNCFYWVLGSYVYQLYKMPFDHLAHEFMVQEVLYIFSVVQTLCIGLSDIGTWIPISDSIVALHMHFTFYDLKHTISVSDDEVAQSCSISTSCLYVFYAPCMLHCQPWFEPGIKYCKSNS